MLQQFIDKYNGKFVEYHSYSAGAENQCVDLANQWLDEGLGLEAIIGTNAADFPGKAVENGMDWIPNFPEGIPDPGDLIIYDGKIGHIDIALEGCTQTKVVAFSQNYPTGSPCVVRSSSYLRPKVVGWLHPRGVVMANELETCLADRKKFWEERDTLLRELQADSVEGGLNTIRGLRSRITDLTNQLGTAQAEVKNKEELLSRCQATLLMKDDDIKSLGDKLDLSNNTVAQLGKDKGDLAIQVEQLKIQVETLKQQSQQGLTTITIKDFLSMLWNGKITLGGK